MRKFSRRERLHFSLFEYTVCSYVLNFFCCNIPFYPFHFQILRKNIELHESSSENSTSCAGEEIIFFLGLQVYVCMVFCYLLLTLSYRINSWETRVGKFWSPRPHFTRACRRIRSGSWSWHLYPTWFFQLVYTYMYVCAYYIYVHAYRLHETQNKHVKDV